jgi:hypothetical protein
MTKERRTSPVSAGFDALRRSLSWTGETLTRIADSGIEAAVHALGLVSDEDLRDIDRSLERLERRLARLEARHRERMSAAAKALDAVGEEESLAASRRGR